MGETIIGIFPQLLMVSLLRFRQAWGLKRGRLVDHLFSILRHLGCLPHERGVPVASQVGGVPRQGQHRINEG